MIQNAQTVLNMLCEDNDHIQVRMKTIFSALDEKQTISLSEHQDLTSPLKMIFTFLSLHTADDVHYIKTDDALSLMDTFKAQLAINEMSKISESSKSTNESGKDTVNVIGPQRPPSKQINIIKSQDTPSDSTTTVSTVPTLSGTVGVTMPTQQDLDNNVYSSDDDDGYGPAALAPDTTEDIDPKRLLQMQQTKIYAEMYRKIENGADAGNPNGSGEAQKRPEWMTTMPESFLSDFDKGTKARGFRTSQQKQDNSWTEAPSDLKRQKEEKKRIKRIQKEAIMNLHALGLPTVEEKGSMDGDDEVVNRNRDKENPVETRNVKREKSLFEIHQETLMADYKEELREWKRKKKRGEKVGKKPVFKGVRQHDASKDYGGSMESYYNAQNPVFTTSKLKTFVSAGNIDQC